jgi:hypothetical protein
VLPSSAADDLTPTHTGKKPNKAHRPARWTILFPPSQRQSFLRLRVFNASRHLDSPTESRLARDMFWEIQQEREIQVTHNGPRPPCSVRQIQGALGRFINFHPPHQISPIRPQVWIKPNGEMPFLYGNHVLKAHLGRITEDTPEHQGVVIYSMNDTPLVRTAPINPQPSPCIQRPPRRFLVLICTPFYL